MQNQGASLHKRNVNANAETTGWRSLGCHNNRRAMAGAKSHLSDGVKETDSVIRVQGRHSSVWLAQCTMFIGLITTWIQKQRLQPSQAGRQHACDLLQRARKDGELSMVCILLKCQSQKTEKYEMHSIATSQYSSPICHCIYLGNGLGTAIIFRLFPPPSERQSYCIWSEKSTLQRSSDPKTFIRFAVMVTWYVQRHVQEYCSLHARWIHLESSRISNVIAP